MAQQREGCDLQDTVSYSLSRRLLKLRKVLKQQGLLAVVPERARRPASRVKRRTSTDRVYLQQATALVIQHTHVLLPTARSPSVATSRSRVC